MFFYWVLLLGLALVFAGGIFFGGIYTLILVPFAVLAAIVAIVYSMFAGGAKRQAQAETDPTGTARDPATNASQTSAPRAPARPGQLADARRGRQ
jgi:predicted lipid-binding transport protein (Tim44 family)